ncbi:MAG TPA: hypothetical protein VE869_05495 [Gemmatimonas sp.]|nr:hypothetical protein [Gemmatimonas sp.]
MSVIDRRERHSVACLGGMYERINVRRRVNGQGDRELKGLGTQGTIPAGSAGFTRFRGMLR